MTLPVGLQVTNQKDGANLILGERTEIPAGWNEMARTRWIYALTTAFPGLVDEVSLVDLKDCWSGDCRGALAGQPLYLSEPTSLAFTKQWGAGASSLVRILPADQILDEANGLGASGTLKFLPGLETIVTNQGVPETIADEGISFPDCTAHATKWFGV